MSSHEEFGTEFGFDFEFDVEDLDLGDVGPVEMRVIEDIEYEEQLLRVAGCVRDWRTLRDLYGADAAMDLGEYMEVVGL
jgi:hypothetical protein